MVPAVRSREEGADLLSRPAGFVALVKLQPGSLLRQQLLLSFLRHEFTHLLDMLDPCFGYESDLSSPGGDPVHDNLIRNRYRVLWDTWIDGRLWQRGWASDEIRHYRRSEFLATFPMLGEDLEERFSDWFEGSVHTHQEMLDFATNPETCRFQVTSGRCPLCRFPSFHLQDGQLIPEHATREIVADFPAWNPAQGLCPQCADLYSSRKLSRSAEKMLPG